MHGMWADAWRYHPWGAVILAYLFVTLVASLVPDATHLGKSISVMRQRPVSRMVWYFLAGGVAVFGVVRAIQSALTR